MLYCVEFWKIKLLQRFHWCCRHFYARMHLLMICSVMFCLLWSQPFFLLVVLLCWWHFCQCNSGLLSTWLCLIDYLAWGSLFTVLFLWKERLVFVFIFGVILCVPKFFFHRAFRAYVASSPTYLSSSVGTLSALGALVMKQEQIVSPSIESRNFVFVVTIPRPHGHYIFLHPRASFPPLYNNGLMDKTSSSGFTHFFVIFILENKMLFREFPTLP